MTRGSWLYCETAEDIVSGGVGFGTRPATVGFKT